MKFYNLLSKIDRQQLQDITQSIQKFKLFMNKKLDELQQLIYVDVQNKTYDPYFLSFQGCGEEIYNEFDQINFEEKFNRFIQNEPQKFIQSNMNEIQYSSPDKIQKLFYYDVIQQLSQLQFQLKSQLELIQDQLLSDQNKNTKIQFFNKNYLQEVWKYPTIDKNQSHSFNVLAESFLCLRNLEFSGFYMAQLFDQKDDQTYQFELSLHSGVNLSQIIFSQKFQVNHKEMLKKNNCYLINIKRSILLNLGQLYSICIKGPKGLKTQVFNNSNEQKQYLLKFFTKEIDSIEQKVCVKQMSKQSPIPGFVFYEQ